MTLIESSPERRIEDPNWTPATPHEAPPVGGALGIYNRGDRHRWYWPWPHCWEYFEAKPGIELFASLPPESELLEVIRQEDITKLANMHAFVFCPHCGSEIKEANKFAMNARGVWAREGERIVKKGRVRGEPVESTIASFWMGGAAAAYQTWRGILNRYLNRLRDYALTGSEESLESSTYTDQGAPYLSRALLAGKTSGHPADNAEDFERFIVPAEARFVTAAVDVQGGQNARFVVQVHAHGPHFEQWLIDRYEIRQSEREGPDGEPAPLDPASYPEDWDVITKRVVKSTYRTTEDGQELRLRMTMVDTGGEDGVTENAYQWWRRCARKRLASRVGLYKGASSRTAPLVKESKVGKGAKADVPLLVCNPNLLKDAVTNAARRSEDGRSRLHFPQWLGAWFWDEWQAEVRKPDGQWEKVRARNEALDLACMNRAAALKLGAAKINWERPPAWARPLENNSERVTTEERREARNSPAKKKRGGFKQSRGFKKSEL